MKHLASLLDAHDFEAGKSQTIEAVVESKECIGSPQSVRANHEIGEDAARARHPCLLRRAA